MQLIKSYSRDPRNWLRNLIWRYPKTTSSRNLVFIVGSPRSGTTLLQRILAIHPKLFSIEGETGIFSYQNIFRRRHFGLPDETLNTLFRTSNDIVDFFDKSIGFLEAKNHGKRFIEKTPQHILHIRFLLKHFPNAKFVHIYRDGRDCYISSLKHPNIPQRHSPLAFARYWRKCIMSWEDVRPSHNLYDIKYEDLASNPAGELAKLMLFLDLAVHENQLNPEFISNDHRSNRDVFKKLKEPINNSSCARWKNEISDEDLAVFLKICGHQLTSLGYETHAR